ncbi:hypothetical protein GQ53DRAFT_755840 [Thozetella sp. PMI_491]|nr:hypothetical protein GQ53DRAFT_755840 [Thozetella sp. PMI_491]
MAVVAAWLARHPCVRLVSSSFPSGQPPRSCTWAWTGVTLGRQDGASASLPPFMSLRLSCRAPITSRLLQHTRRSGASSSSLRAR